MELNKNDMQQHIAAIELTKMLCGKPCDICKFYGQHPKCMPVHNAEKIAAAGYRKASEVAREIFEEIEKIVEKEIYRCDSMRDKYDSERIYFEGGRHSLQKARYWLAELKKKYTEGEG